MFAYSLVFQQGLRAVLVLEPVRDCSYLAVNGYACVSALELINLSHTNCLSEFWKIYYFVFVEFEIENNQHLFR